MIVVAFFIAYWVIGAWLARGVFIRTLGNEPRTRKLEYSKETTTTSAFDNAMFASVGTFLLWPVVIPIEKFIMAPTPAEKDAVDKARLAELEKMVKEYGL